MSESTLTESSMINEPENSEQAEDNEISEGHDQSEVTHEPKAINHMGSEYDDQPEDMNQPEDHSQQKTVKEPKNSWFMSRFMVPFWLILIVLLAATFRFTGIDWDDGHHLHPDERFLTIVVNDIKWPESNFISSYFDEANSTLNPRNMGKTFYVYGDFPINVVKGVVVLMDEVVPREDGQSWQGYGQAYKVGRVLDGVMDLGTLLVLFALGYRLYRDYRIALLASLLYAGTALAIQQAHFFVVDSFTAFFVTVALYFMVRMYQDGKLIDYLLAGAFFGVSMSTKLSIFTLSLVVAAVGAYRLYIESEEDGFAAALERTVFRLTLSAVMAIVMFRILQPTSFEGLFSIAPRWWQNAQEARSWVSGERDAPFAHQWTSRTVFWFPWKNMVLWGMGLPLGLAAWAGWGVGLWQIIRRKKWVHFVPVLWIGILFFHQGAQWVKSLRYFLPIYPMLVLMAAWFLVWLWDKSQETGQEGLLAWTPRKAGALLVGVTLATLIYAFGFTSIYTRPHTRVEASEWIYDNVPAGAIVANETVWDDGIPLRRPNRPPMDELFQVKVPLNGVPNYDTLSEEEKRQFQVDTTLNITDEDDPGKWYGRPHESGYTQPGILDKLDQIDYYFISSNRQYDSMSRIPMRFPAVINFYDALFSGELGYERVAEFTSYPHLLGIELPDQGAEEAWHVYDHNRVQIFRRTEAYSREKAEALILGDVEWDEIQQLWPKDVGNWSGTLKLSSEEQAIYKKGGTWSLMFNRESLSNQLPLLFWVLVLQVLGLLTYPYLALIARHLPARGYTFAKALGLLMVTWLVWFLASLKLLAFSMGSILFAMCLVGLGGLALTRYKMRKLNLSLPELIKQWWQKDKGLFLRTEAVFWAFFLLVLAIRWANPDLWYDPMGGEKPMDFSYLNAVTKSTYFPPMDPWFSGGYINYYYFGFVLVAVLIKLTGILPEIAYNLAVPTLFAMLAAGVWGAALALLVPIRQKNQTQTQLITRSSFWFATLAALFVSVLGNLGEIKVLRNISSITLNTGIPGAEGILKSLDGIVRGFMTILSGETLPGRLEWPYWNATRTIPETINEFPWFTYLYADLHAHMMALPFTVLVIGLSLMFLRAKRNEDWLTEGVRLFLLALAIGSLWPINTWDFPTYALVAFAGLGLREWRHDGAITIRGVVAVLWRWALVLVVGRLLFQPFHANLGSAYSSVELWDGSRTGLTDFLTVHGLFLFCIFAALVSDFLFGRGHNQVIRLARLRLRSFRRYGRVKQLYDQFTNSNHIYSTILTIFVLVMGVILLASVFGLTVPSLTLFLLLFSLALFFRSRPQPLWQMALFFIMLGLGLTLVVEIVVLKGDIGRMNTVFKFYLQVWVLWGMAAALGTARILTQEAHWWSEWRVLWRVGFVLLVSLSALYPIFATHAKINDRFDRSVGPTLNGAAFMEKAIYQEQDRVRNVPAPIALKWDAEAIRWIQENLPGSPVIAEINTAPDRLYGWGNRISMWTGNPAIVGWDHHQRQQRAAARSEEVNERVREVKDRIYNTPDSNVAYNTLQRYGADYLIVGALERAYSSDEGIAKFDAQRGILWDLVYENPEVKIYRVLK